MEACIGTLRGLKLMDCGPAQIVQLNTIEKQLITFQTKKVQGKR